MLIAAEHANTNQFSERQFPVSLPGQAVTEYCPPQNHHSEVSLVVIMFDTGVTFVAPPVFAFVFSSMLHYLCMTNPFMSLILCKSYSNVL